MKKILLITSMFGLFVFAGCTSPSISSVTTKDTTTGSIVTGQTTTGYTIQDVAAHATADSCRSIIRNGVYDLTSRAPEHPGGSGKILAICGKDATAVFEKVHGGKEKQEMKLTEFFIGNIK